MSMFLNSRFYPKNFVLLGTDSDKLTKQVELISNEASQCFKAEFTGERAVFPFQLRYAAPFEGFAELKRIQYEARKHVRFKSDYFGYIAIDLSEFLAHEEEMYFDITLKFLHDQMEFGWKYIFVIDNTNQRNSSLLLKKVLSLLRCSVQVVNQPCVCNTLEDWVNKINTRYAIQLSHDAKMAIEPLFILKSFDERVGEAVMDELAMIYGCERVLMQSDVKSYLTSQLSSLRYLISEADFRAVSKIVSNGKECA